MIDPDAAAGLSGDLVVDPDGREVGRIAEVFLDDATGRPAWAAVATGPGGGRRTFVPLADAEFMGNRLRLSHGKAVIEAAPPVQVTDGHLDPEATAELDRYYRGPGAAAATGAAGPADGVTVTRSEEQLRVGTEWTGSERVRLRKVVVTEDVTVTVPVSHEELRVEREPLGAGDDGRGPWVPAGSAVQHEIVLHAQRPVVTTEVVPVERVRVSTVTVAGQTTVTEPLRQERVEVETDPAPDAGRP
jgi:uncharacterized protein (TIGR02271 family)